MMGEFENYLSTTGEVGFISRIVSSLAYVEGLPSAKPYERVMFENGESGQIISLGEHALEIMSFSRNPLVVGMKVARTGSLLEMPVGKEFLGFVIDPLGISLNSKTVITPSQSRPLESTPLGIRFRSKINQPCETGITIADIMVPLGKGQRQLILGDQKTGKTSFLLRTLHTQVMQGSIGIYAAVGKSKLVIRQVEEFLRTAGIVDRTIIVAAYAEDPASIIHLVPYAAMTLAEYFRDEGNDVLIVLDDLSTHAKMYREMALLGRRSPGRNAYPGDIFYIHSRLLERAGNFLTPKGEKAITCLPVIEAPRGDITGYIPTNSISMTDGHVFFDYNLYVEGRRPAINPFLSVTRVGKQTQPKIKNEINNLLSRFLNEAEKLQVVSSFGAELGEHIRTTLQKRDRVLVFFDQMAHEIIPNNLQLVLFALVWNGAWEDQVAEALGHQLSAVSANYHKDAGVKKRIDELASASSSLNDLLRTVYSPDVLLV